MAKRNNAEFSTPELGRKFLMKGIGTNFVVDGIHFGFIYLVHLTSCEPKQ